MLLLLLFGSLLFLLSPLLLLLILLFQVLNEIKKAEKNVKQKIPNAPSLSKKKDQFTFQQNIQGLDKLHEVLQELVINPDQGPLLHITVGNATLSVTNSVLQRWKGSKQKKYKDFLPHNCCWSLSVDPSHLRWL